MKYIMKVNIPVEKGNVALKDPQFGQKMKALLSKLRQKQLILRPCAAKEAPISL